MSHFILHGIELVLHLYLHNVAIYLQYCCIFVHIMYKYNAIKIVAFIICNNVAYLHYLMLQLFYKVSYT